jgi:hypothetical protein
MKRTIYLAGPVSSIDEAEYIGHFRKAADEISRRVKAESLDIKVLNPVAYCAGTILKGSPWHVYMRACVSRLALCDGIGLLQGWDKSQGARLEYNLSQELRIPVVYLEAPVDEIALTSLLEAGGYPDVIRYYQARLDFWAERAERGEESAERALFETCHRYLDPYGFEYL